MNNLQDIVLLNKVFVILNFLSKQRPLFSSALFKVVDDDNDDDEL